MAFERARHAQRAWRCRPLQERVTLVGGMVAKFEARKDQLAEELSWQMGRPIAQTPGEIRGFVQRATAMLAMAPEVLANLELDARRKIQRDPLGVVLTVAAWNYPYLIAVNSVVPALVAGNAVLLKHSAQTPLCAERMVEAAADLPEGLFQCLHMDHELTAEAVNLVDFVCFTGSVSGGRAIQRAAAREHFIGVGLELGGKDPAYVRPDADLEHALEQLVDGAFYNSGQSCCGIERIYVHRSLYDAFVEGFVERTRAYRLGNPLDPTVNLGPVISPAAAQAICQQVDEAIAQGARPHLPAHRDRNYLGPQVLTGVTHDMTVMMEETFGPVVGIMPVEDDREAINLMNDSPYGLTASLWTRDLERADQLGQEIETGTVFANRCDYLDPELAWTGVKDTGRGCTLSRVGYEQLTRPKSFNFVERP